MHCCHGNHILETHWYLSLFAFADKVLGAGARPAGCLRGTGWRREGEKRGERRGAGKRGKRGEQMERREREGDRRKEGGEEGSRKQTASQGDPEFSGLCPEKKEAPCALSMDMYK